MLAVDDELPALEDLVRMLEASPAVEQVESAASAEEALAGRGPGIGLGNVHGRLQSTFGEGYGLEVEAGDGRGTTVVMTLPKFRAGVRAA